MTLRQITLVIATLGHALFANQVSGQDLAHQTRPRNSSESERPNILWVTTEDIGPHLGCYGDNVAKTPNLDALARKGMLYEVAWSNFPVCAPARTTIITGMYAAANGAGNMRSNVPLPKSIRMFPELLREAGYYCTNNKKEDYNHPKPGKVWDDSSGKAHWKNRGAGQPFFAVFNHAGTHESRIRKRPHNAVTSPAVVRLPAYWPDTPEVRQDWAQYYDNIARMDKWVGKKLAELESAGQSDNTIVFFFSDHGSGMPRHKRWAGDSGMRVPLVVYVPDKWRHLAPADYRPGARSKRLVGFVDLAPATLSTVKIKPPNHMQGRSFMGHYQSEPPKYLYGFRDRMDERPDLSRSVRDQGFLYIRNYMPHLPAGQHLSYQFETPTTRVWKRLFDDGQLSEIQNRFWRLHPPEELYDLAADPDETTNLIDRAEYRSELARLRKILKDNTVKIRDASFIPEPELFETSKRIAVGEYVADPSRYPLEQILQTAEAAARRDSESMAELIAAASSDNSTIRYWAAVGLLVRGPQLTREQRALWPRFLDDSSDSVVITAAEALARYAGGPDRERALNVLLERADLRHANYYAATWSLNSIDRLSELASPILDRVSKLPTEAKHIARGNNYLERLVSKISGRNK